MQDEDDRSLPQGMQALVLRHESFAETTSGLTVADLGALVALARIAVPTPGLGRVRVRVALAPVNPSDLHFLKIEYVQPRRRGTPAGFEGTGTVVAAADAQGAALVGRPGPARESGPADAWRDLPGARARPGKVMLVPGPDASRRLQAGACASARR